jgi:hypothetical protein
MYRPVNASKASGSSGERYTQLAGFSPTPRAKKMPMTTATKMIDTQPCICRIQAFQFMGTSFQDDPKRGAPGPAAYDTSP